MAFDEYRQAHLDFFECLESFGGHGNWSVIDDYGQPEIAYSVTWDTYVGDMSPEEQQDATETLLAHEDYCTAEHHIVSMRTAYENNRDAETSRRLSMEERWEAGFPAVIECFAATGANVDDSTTRSRPLECTARSDVHLCAWRPHTGRVVRR